MAKSVNGLGKFSGKLGGSVFVIRNGQQIVREYNPAPSNPKSAAQRLQRAKGNLVGRISKITPYQILTGLGGSRPARRSRFHSLALNNATALVDANDSSVINAKLDINNFVFSEGAIMPAMNITQLSATVNSVQATVSRIANVSDEFFNASGLLVVVVILQASGEWESVLYRYVDSSSLSGGYVSVTFPHINEGEYTAYALAAPFTTENGVSVRAVANSLFGEGNSFAANMEYNPAALPLLWGMSQYKLSSTYTPNAKSNAKSKLEAK